MTKIVLPHSGYKKLIVNGGALCSTAGRYHILRRLGQGGMGAVLLTEDQQLDGRQLMW